MYNYFFSRIMVPVRVFDNILSVFYNALSHAMFSNHSIGDNSRKFIPCYLHHNLSLQSCLEEIHISGWFVTRLDICAVAETPHVYKKKKYPNF